MEKKELSDIFLKAEEARCVSGLCPKCKGEKSLPSLTGSPGFSYTYYSICDKCNGTGYAQPVKCLVPDRPGKKEDIISVLSKIEAQLHGINVSNLTSVNAKNKILILKYINKLNHAINTLQEEVLWLNIAVRD